MKLWPLCFALAGICAGAMGGARHDRWTIVVSGDTNGYLSPCGCSFPMSGGIRRRISVVRGDCYLYLDNGSLIKRTGRQDRMKAETLIQAMVEGEVSAINLTPSEAALGKGTILSLASLSKNRLISSHLTDPTLDVPRWIEKGPFLIGAATTRPGLLATALETQSLPLQQTLEALLAEAEARAKTPILLLNGDQEQAKKIATDSPAIRLIVYSSDSDAPAKETRLGDTVLISPGDKGRAVARIDFEDQKFTGYQPIPLGPEHKNDPQTAQIYASYLKRIDSAGLLEQLPRAKGDPFAGNEKCISCHAEAGKIWKGSAHAHALATLEKEGHAKDPDCVSCHVVGLAFDTGFKSRLQTPDLTDVGCESCHGAGAAHSAKPYLERMTKLGPKACIGCHNPENSPRFDYESYWQKIKH